MQELRMIDYEDADNGRPAAVMAAHITHLAKESTGDEGKDVTLIHLINALLAVGSSVVNV